MGHRRPILNLGSQFLVDVTNGPLERMLLAAGAAPEEGVRRSPGWRARKGPGPDLGPNALFKRGVARAPRDRARGMHGGKVVVRDDVHHALMRTHLLEVTRNAVSNP